jgi:hypothetical protein
MFPTRLIVAVEVESSGSMKIEEPADVVRMGAEEVEFPWMERVPTTRVGP